MIGAKRNHKAALFNANIMWATLKTDELNYNNIIQHNIFKVFSFQNMINIKDINGILYILFGTKSSKCGIAHF